MSKPKFPRRKPSAQKRLQSVVESLGLVSCKRCWHFHQPGFLCYECGFDNSLPQTEQPAWQNQGS
jgi:ribosomal protein L32